MEEKKDVDEESVKQFQMDQEKPVNSKTDLLSNNLIVDNSNLNLVASQMTNVHFHNDMEIRNTELKRKSKKYLALKNKIFD